MDYRRVITVDMPYEQAVARTKEALAEQGFGILTEIDIQATLRAKRGIEMEPYVILGACNPDLAAQALQIERGVGVLLPCNVVVSAEGERSKVQVLEPELMAAVTEVADLQPMADEASRLLDAALRSLAND